MLFRKKFVILWTICEDMNLLKRLWVHLSHFFKRSPEDAISSGLFCLLSVQQFFNVVEFVCFQER